MKLSLERESKLLKVAEIGHWAVVDNKPVRLSCWRWTSITSYCRFPSFYGVHR